MNDDTKILIIGLGEIGYSNAEYMSHLGLHVYGYDRERRAVQRAVHEGVIEKEATCFSGFDYYVICISTHNPENLYQPSLEGIFDIAQRLSKEGTDGALITVESTIAKGTCNILHQAVDHKLHVAHFPHRYYSKEKEEHGVRQLRVLGGCEDCCSVKAIGFYRDLLGIPFYHVRSIELAELSKIIENSYRFLEIAFSEELRLFCEAYNLDYSELREAINSKWNMNLLEAMDGIGGHCLPKDTQMYLQSLNRVCAQSIIRSALDIDDRYKREFIQEGKPKDRTPLQKLAVKRTVIESTISTNQR
ncbi:MAG: NAD(P)-binding domain-containing protein [Candidatus Bathyarchaeota archaeon]